MSTADTAQEQFLAQYHASLEVRGLARIRKVQIPISIQRKLPGGRILGRLEGSPDYDYEGVIRGGRAVCFEAKAIAPNSRRWTLGNVKPHQRRALTARAQLGGTAWIMLDWRGSFVVPIETYNHFLELGWKSVLRESLVERCLKVPNGAGWYEALMCSGEYLK